MGDKNYQYQKIKEIAVNLKSSKKITRKYYVHKFNDIDEKEKNLKNAKNHLRPIT